MCCSYTWVWSLHISAGIKAVTSGMHCLRPSLLFPSAYCHERSQTSTCASVGRVGYLQGRECMHVDVRGASFGGFQQPQVCLPCTPIWHQDSTVLLSAQKPPSEYMHGHSTSLVLRPATCTFMLVCPDCEAW